MSVLIDNTLTNVQALSTNPQQRKIIKASDGTLLLFAMFYISNQHILKYKKSIDNGVTWGSWVTVNTSANGSATSFFFFDICINLSTNDIYVTFADFSSTWGIYYIKMTYSAGSWSLGTRYLVHNNFGGSGQSPSTCFNTIRSNGEIWVYCYFGSTTNIYSNSNNDGSGAWTDKSVPQSVTASGLLAVGSNIWVIYQRATGLYYRIYTTSWGAEQTITSSGITADYISCLRVTDSNLWIVARTSSGLKAFNYISSWDAGTLISSNTNDNYSSISIYTGGIVVVYSGYDTVQYDIYYARYSGVWATPVRVVNDATIDQNPSTVISDNFQLYIIWLSGSANPYTIYFQSLNLCYSITSDAVLLNSFQKVIYSDAKLKKLAIQELIFSNAKLAHQNTILADAKLKKLGIQNTLLSDAILIPLYEFINKINFVGSILFNITNKVNIVIRILSDVSNFLVTCKSNLYDTINDFRTQKLTVDDAINDVRFMYSWQKSATGILQSLGKSYIRVYIGEVEQLDIDIDSISISEDVNSPFTATFNLGRPYDSTKPAIESAVSIKYNDWVLYSGYITSISPASRPETITINCEDEFWKQNRTKTYFYVGYKPSDEDETYYATIRGALLSVFNWTLNLGSFVPQTIDCFGQGISDAISNLITNAGNYGWYYDKNKNKTLWTAGEGDIVNIDRQQIGSNIGLYHLLKHNFSDDISGLVNRFRVQMGDQVFVRIGNFKQEVKKQVASVIDYSLSGHYLTPAWNSQYEVLAKNSSTGYGFDYQKKGEENYYKDVYLRYKFPTITNPQVEYSDEFAPDLHAEVFFLASDEELTYKNQLPATFSMYNIPIKTGYTVDYKNNEVVFNNRIYIYKKNKYGEIISTRSPTIKMYAVLKWTYPTENNFDIIPPPGGGDPFIPDTVNPLFFITDKMGDYPTEVREDLNLTGLGIQIGGRFINSDGNYVIVPSWNDVPYARDYANWQLSKKCDKKIRGVIEITLDTMCFYNIDLSKRIYIEGITEVPMNINSINYNLSNFTVSLSLENHRYFKRFQGIPNRTV